MKKVFSMLFTLLLSIFIGHSVVFAATKYNVVISVEYNNSALRYANIVIYDEASNEVAKGDTDRNGRFTTSLEDGKYRAEVYYVSGNYEYVGTTSFEVNGRNLNVDLTVQREYLTSSAESRYNNVNYFDHVDVRVNGTFTEIRNGTVIKHNIKLQNVNLKVFSSSESNATTLVNKNFTNNNETYEWRQTGLRVPKSAVIKLTMDIYYNNNLLRDNYVVTFSGKDAFIEAIKNCDAYQGLDFRIDPQEIINDIFYEVDYEWSLMVEEDGQVKYQPLPSTVGIKPPETTGDYIPTAKHKVDTVWENGYLITDPTTKYVYEFLGWSEYKYESESTKRELSSDEITTSDNATIYGVWIIKEIPAPPEGTLIIEKNFYGNYKGVVPNKLHFRVTEHIAGVEFDVEVYYSQFVDGKFEITIYETGMYTIKEVNYELPGHEFLSDLSTSTTQNITVTDLEAENKVVFNNHYKKKTGRTINESILTIRKEDSITHNSLGGAKFTLKNKETGELVRATSTETTESGYIGFVGLTAGVYELVETDAPYGYYMDDTVYIVTVTEKIGQEYLDLETDTYITVVTYEINVTPDTRYNINNNRLTIHNDKMYGDITISKEFGSNSDINKNNLPSNVVIEVIIKGDNYEETFELNASNNYSVTINGLELGEYEILERVTSIDDYELTTTYSKKVVNLTEDVLSDSVVITNTYKEIITTIDVSVNKVWELNGSKVELPESIQVGLYKDNVLINKQTLNASNNWFYKWTKLDDKYTWTVREITELEDFTSNVTNTGNNYTITNTYNTTYTTLDVIKVWDKNGSKVELPTSVEVALCKDGVCDRENTVILNSANEWKTTFTNLDDTYTWTVEEVTSLDDYTVTITNVGNVFTITNTYKSEYTTLDVTKVWNLNGSKVELPESIKVGLYKDGQLINTQYLSETNNWYYKWTELDTTYTWTVKEITTLDNFETSLTQENNSVTITNTYQTTYTTITVTKDWDFNNVLGLEKFEVEVALCKDGVCDTENTVTLNEDNNWTYEFTSLDDTYTWTVKEVTEKEGFESTINDNYVITNKYTGEYSTITISKIWDNNGHDVITPESATITLYLDGKLYKTITLDESNNWTVQFKIAEGIEHFVDEIDIPEGYEKEIVKSDNVYTVTNTYLPNDLEEKPNDNDVPKTGDDEEIIVYLITLATSITALGLNVVTYKKRFN